MSQENKTIETNQNVFDFIARLQHPQKEADSQKLVMLMQELTGKPPKMWGSSIIGFGKYHYKYASGREGDTCEIGFSPRKAALTIYLNGDVKDYEPFLKELGPHKLGKGCLYVKDLNAIDTDVLAQLLETYYKDFTKR